MKRFIVIFILCLGGIFVILGFSEIEGIIQSLQRANPGYLSLAIFIEIGWFAILGLTYKSLYRLLGMKESLSRLIMTAAASSFVSVVMPSAGVGGLAIFISDGQKRGNLPGKITVAGALYLLLDEAAFLCVLAVGIILLVKHNNLSSEEISASIVLLCIALALALVLYLGYRSHEMLGNLLAKVANIINSILRPLIRRDYLSEARAHSFAAEIGEGLGSLPKKPFSLVPPFLFLLINKVLLMGILVTAYLSFNVPFTVGKIIAGFSIAYLFLIVSPTPSGIGIVEGVMTLALHSLRISLGNALVVTLAYRAVTFWMPLAVGALAFRFLNSGNNNEPVVESKSPFRK